MLVFNEGVPRAGKSYDAVAEHILPALKKGRRVFARLNGLDHEKIALHLGMPVDDMRRLLVLVESEQVKETFCALQAEGGRWAIPDYLKDALFIIDECHEFYVSSRDAMEPATEQFFALHGQNGMDGILLSQWYKRLHVAIRARIERKNVFQKLTAAGMRGHYRVNFYQTIAPDKFETTGGVTRKYDPKIFPLYAGYTSGAENVEVYDEGGRTIFHMLKGRALFIVPIALVSAWYLVSFFTGGAKFTKSARAAEQSETAHTAAKAVEAGTGVPVTQVVAPPAPKLNPLQQYVADLSEKGRVRLAARILSEAGEVGLVEWIDASGVAVERMTTRQIQALGWDVYFLPFGVELNAMGERYVVTAWPLNVPLREEAPKLYNLSPDQQPPPSGVPSEASLAQGRGAGSPHVGQTYDFPNP